MLNNRKTKLHSVIKLLYNVFSVIVTFSKRRDSNSFKLYLPSSDFFYYLFSSATPHILSITWKCKIIKNLYILCLRNKYYHCILNVKITSPSSKHPRPPPSGGKNCVQMYNDVKVKSIYSTDTLNNVNYLDFSMFRK